MRLLLVLAVLLLALPVHARTFYVDSEIDDVDALPGDGVCATSVGACTLRAAIQETNALTGEDTIEVPTGDFVLTIEGIDEDDGATGDLDIRDHLVLTGAGLDETTIDAAGLDRVFHVLQAPPPDYTSPSVEFSGVTVTGGESSWGAGIFVDYYGTFSTFDSAVAGNRGGGIEVAPHARLLLSGGIVEGNIADTFVGGIGCYQSSITIEHSTIRGNSGGEGVGVVECDAIIRDSVIADNSGTYTGGLGVGESDVLIEGTTIRNNRSEWGAGGVSLFLAQAQISNSTIAGNQSDSGAGGILAGSLTHASITNTTISGNSGFGAGGVGLDTDASRSQVSFTNSTIVDNYSAQRGGGIAGTGMTVLVGLKNSILAKNSAALGGPDCFMDAIEPGVVGSGGHNILGDASGCDFESSTGDQVGTAESPIDPLIGPLLDNGGPTKTHALLAGSPAIDAIPVAYCTYDDDDDSGTPEVPLTEDQRGVSRPQGEACDIGAYEATSCSDGIDNDRDGTIDWNDGPWGKPADPGCVDASDLSERDPFLSCDDGADNDGDGKTDFDPFTFAHPGDETTPPSGSGDPGCYSPSWSTENPQCQDGKDNDADGMIDYDGGFSALGYVAAAPDPKCHTPLASEVPVQFWGITCGLGAELALLLPPLMWMWRRRRPLH